MFFSSGKRENKKLVSERWPSNPTWETRSNSNEEGRRRRQLGKCPLRMQAIGGTMIDSMVLCLLMTREDARACHALKKIVVMIRKRTDDNGGIFRFNGTIQNAYLFLWLDRCLNADVCFYIALGVCCLLLTIICCSHLLRLCCEHSNPSAKAEPHLPRIQVQLRVFLGNVNVMTWYPLGQATTPILKIGICEAPFRVCGKANENEHHRSFESESKALHWS